MKMTMAATIASVVSGSTSDLARPAAYPTEEVDFAIIDNHDLLAGCTV
jgi:hypothetical protein